MGGLQDSRASSSSPGTSSSSYPFPGANEGYSPTRLPAYTRLDDPTPNNNKISTKSDSDSKDQPPKYPDEETTEPPSSPTSPCQPAPPTGPPTAPAKCLKSSSAPGGPRYMDPRLDSDPEYLQHWIEHLSESPPRLIATVEGWHTVTKRWDDGETESSTHSDFHIKFEFTPWIFTDPQRSSEWKTIETVGGGDKVRRGTVRRTCAPGFGKSKAGKAPAGTEYEKPTLREWCHRYCARDTGLKSFALRKYVQGFDEGKMKACLASVIRATRYAGDISISFETKDERASVFSDSRVNRMRLRRWVRWVCHLTGVSLITGPILYFSTKKYEVVDVRWDFSRTEDDGRGGKVERYAFKSEKDLADHWAVGLSGAVVGGERVTLGRGHAGMEGPRAKGYYGWGRSTEVRVSGPSPAQVAAATAAATALAATTYMLLDD